jgi:branched-subunit amino acid ABC-type transport system permease component
MMASGLTLIFGVLRIINIAQGAVESTDAATVVPVGVVVPATGPDAFALLNTTACLDG